MKKWLVTGGAGFIGGNFVLAAVQNRWAKVLNYDKLTYAGNLQSLKPIEQEADYSFVKGDIGSRETLIPLIKEFKPTAIINFAAESHVDRSIEGPSPFFTTNVMGTLNLLEGVRDYLKEAPESVVDGFRFLHISTDEVYGSLKADDPRFTESNRFEPNSPYAASKASSDHVVRSYNKTFGIPTLTSNCSNNYGPLQFPEKMIPLMIIKALQGKEMPIYGDGQQVRDWLHVADHVAALKLLLDKGLPGETYNIGGDNEVANIDLVRMICHHLDQFKPGKESYTKLMVHVTDRPGHDRRYAIDNSKLTSLGFRCQHNLESGLKETIRWYLEHEEWWGPSLDGTYRGQRLGLGGY